MPRTTAPAPLGAYLPPTSRGPESPPPAPAPAAAGTPRVAALDGVRGVAILAVVWFHCNWSMGLLPIRGVLRIDELYYRVRVTGWAGVDLFFVLSGFLITGILIDARGRPHYFRDFYVRRTLRIFPPYYLLLAGILALAVALRGGAFGADPAAWTQIWRVKWWLVLYGTNLKAALQHTPEVAPYVSHLWSLAVEEQFYLTWPLVVAVCPPRRLGLVCVLTMLGGLTFRLALAAEGANVTGFDVHVLTPGRIDTLAAGGLLAVLARRPGGLAAARRWCWVPLLPSLAFLAWIVRRNGALLFFQREVALVGYSAVAIACAAFVLIALDERSVVARAMRARWLRFLGAYSYGIYLYHWPVAAMLTAAYPGARHMPMHVPSRVPFELAYSLLVLGVSTLAALASWHLLEKRCLALKERWAPNVGTARLSSG